MDIIFIGSIYPHEREDEIRQNSKGGIDNAANNFQWALLKGLDHFYHNLIVVTQPAIRTFPAHYKKIYFKGSAFSHKPGAIDYCLGFINLPLIKHWIKEKKLNQKLNEVVNKKEQTIIIIYGIHSPFLKAAVNIKNGNSNVKICLVAPDLPQFMTDSRNLIYRFLKYLDSIIINKCLKKVDAFVPLNENMLDYLKIGKRPWIRVEGIFNTELSIIDIVKENKKTILYTGNIGERYGIKTLINAFSLIRDKNYRLWIRGNGDAKDYILDAAKFDSRIIYFDELSIKKLLELLKRATLLINPTPQSEHFSKYFFPSKIINYMASGTPTLTTRIDGIPDEYYQYCYLVKEDNAEGLRKAILHVCEKDQKELDEFGRKASKFILENKNPISQVRKIYDMLNTLSTNL